MSQVDNSTHHRGVPGQLEATLYPNGTIHTVTKNPVGICSSGMECETKGWLQMSGREGTSGSTTILTATDKTLPCHFKRDVSEILDATLQREMSLLRQDMFESLRTTSNEVALLRRDMTQNTTRVMDAIANSASRESAQIDLSPILAAHRVAVAYTEQRSNQAAEQAAAQFHGVSSLLKTLQQHTETILDLLKVADNKAPTQLDFAPVVNAITRSKTEVDLGPIVDAIRANRLEMDQSAAQQSAAVHSDLRLIHAAVQQSGASLSGAIAERRVEINFSPVLTAFQQETASVLAAIEQSLAKPLRNSFEVSMQEHHSEMMAAIQERKSEKAIVGALEQQRHSEAEVLTAIQEGIGQLSDIITASACSCHRTSNVPTVRVAGAPQVYHQHSDDSVHVAQYEATPPDRYGGGVYAGPSARIGVQRQRPGSARAHRVMR